MADVMTLPFARPAGLAEDVRVRAEALWDAVCAASQCDVDAALDIDEQLAALLGLGPGEGHDELTRCEYDRCDAWFWADEGATLQYADGAELQVCRDHAQADDPGARVYPGAALAADWQEQEAAASSHRIRTLGMSR